MQCQFSALPTTSLPWYSVSTPIESSRVLPTTKILHWEITSRGTMWRAETERTRMKMWGMWTTMPIMEISSTIGKKEITIMAHSKFLRDKESKSVEHDLVYILFNTFQKEIIVILIIGQSFILFGGRDLHSWFDLASRKGKLHPDRSKRADHWLFPWRSSDKSKPISFHPCCLLQFFQKISINEKKKHKLPDTPQMQWSSKHGYIRFPPSPSLLINLAALLWIFPPILL